MENSNHFIWQTKTLKYVSIFSIWIRRKISPGKRFSGWYGCKYRCSDAVNANRSFVGQIWTSAFIMIVSWSQINSRSIRRKIVHLMLISYLGHTNAAIRKSWYLMCLRGPRGVRRGNMCLIIVMTNQREKRVLQTSVPKEKVNKIAIQKQQRTPKTNHPSFKKKYFNF